MLCYCTKPKICTPRNKQEFVLEVSRALCYWHRRIFYTIGTSHWHFLFVINQPRSTLMPLVIEWTSRLHFLIHWTIFFSIIHFLPFFLQTPGLDPVLNLIGQVLPSGTAMLFFYLKILWSHCFIIKGKHPRFLSTGFIASVIDAIYIWIPGDICKGHTKM